MYLRYMIETCLTLEMYDKIRGKGPVQW